MDTKKPAQGCDLDGLYGWEFPAREKSVFTSQPERGNNTRPREPDKGKFRRGNEGDAK